MACQSKKEEAEMGKQKHKTQDDDDDDGIPSTL